MIFDENILGTNLLNSSFGLLHSDQFDISKEFGLTIPFFEDSTKQSNSTHNFTGIWLTFNNNFNTPTHSNKNH